MPRSLHGRLTLGLKLGTIIALCVATAIVIVATLFFRQAQDRADHQALTLATEAANAVADRVSDRLDNEFKSLLAAADALSALHDFRADDRTAEDAIMRHLIASGSAEQAAWIIWTAPLSRDTAAQRGRVDTKGAFRPMVQWTRDGSKIAQVAGLSADINDPLYREPLIGRAFIRQPHDLATSDGRNIAVMSYAVPITSDGSVVGAVGLDVAAEALQRSVARIYHPAGGALTLASQDGIVVATTMSALKSKSLRDGALGFADDFAAARQSGRRDRVETSGKGPMFRSVQAITFSSVKAPWFAVVELPLAAFTTSVTGDSMPMLGPAIAVLLGVLGVILVAIRAIVTRPLANIEQYIRALGDAQSSNERMDIHRSDEIGSIAKALVGFKTSRTEIQKLKLAKSEHEERNARARQDEMKALADQLASSVQAIAGLVEATTISIMKRAERMADTASESIEKAKIIVGASAVAASSVGAVDAAANNLHSAIDQISFEAQDARHVASHAAAQAKDSAIVTEELFAKALQIGVVVETISKIARQTNLLALNATIEAARSGEAGRAFAIVAQEVKALAAQTAAATEDVARQIDAIQATAANAATVMASINATVERIDDISTTISTAVTIQGEATGSITGFVGTAVTATRHVDTAIEDVDRCANETGQVAAEMLKEIATLANVSKQLNEQVSDVIARIRLAQAA